MAEDLADGVCVSVLQGVVGHLDEAVRLSWVDRGGEFGCGETQPGAGQGHPR